MKSRKERIIKQEDRFLRFEKSWRRARTGAIFLAVILTVITFCAKIWLHEELIEESKDISELVWGIVCLLFIALYCDLRLQHIDTIKRYRKMNPKDEQKD
ncbi:MAG: hypothetical protein ACYS0I_13460 [Planctomycetota bacterium]|jgi:hypothetical protein